MNMGKKNALAVAIGLSLAAPMSLQAQELEEILVTGTKRAASLEDARLPFRYLLKQRFRKRALPSGRLPELGT